MTLRELFAGAGIDPVAIHGDAPIAGICSDSRRATLGCIFVCMPSSNSDSHSFLPAAKAAGAVAAIVHSSEGFEIARSLSLTVAQLPNEGWSLNSDLCKICNVFFNYPTRNMKVVGVTGTNGKTTTAWLIRDMLQALGLKAAYLGTLGFQIPDEERELANTTPFPVDLYSMLAEARDKGVEALAMEVSSHALEERRCEYVEFDVGVFTNLTQDHMDFHGTMEAYEAAKLRLFTELPKQTNKRFVWAVNTDDAFGARLEEVLPPQTGFGFGEERSGGLWVTPHEVELDRIRMSLMSREVTVPLGGYYNVENTASAAAGVIALGFSLDQVVEALPKVRSVPGRFEPVRNDDGTGILIDYAHTPDALEKLLDAVRDLTQGRVITVFGCGGDRDRNKRPKMAKSASERSDVTIVTSDNPRTEDPRSIINEVLPGIAPGKEHVAIIDRGEAIVHAIEIAKPGDVVVIAGKGHENYQIIGRTKHPMDDRELAREGLRKRSEIGVNH